jgi:hypothetical protein
MRPTPALPWLPAACLLVALPACAWIPADEHAARADELTRDSGSPDDDCDSAIGENGATGATTWYLDSDGDGFGNAEQAVDACDQPPGFVADPTDCNDDDRTVNPAMTDVCTDAIDQDCSGGVSVCAANGDETVPGAGDTLYGGSAAGSSVTTGDVSGDGTADVVVGAPGADGAGTVYVVPPPFLTEMELSRAWLFSGEDAGDLAGTVAVGDVSGDGVADLVVGAPQARGVGEVYIKRGPIEGGGTLADAETKLVPGTGFAGAGRELALGDADDDGTLEIAVAAYSTDVGDPSGVGILGGDRLGLVTDAAGEIFVVDGSATGSVSLSGGAWIASAEGSFGRGPVLADLTDDGWAELVVGALTASVDGSTASPGLVDIYAGPLGTGEILSPPLARLVGIDDRDRAGYASLVADLDGDGSNDLVTSAIAASEGDLTADGAVYVVLGPILGDGNLGGATTRIEGSNAEAAGTSLSAGDTNGDGALDLVIGAPFSGCGDGRGGAVYVVLGPMAPHVALAEDAWARVCDTKGGAMLGAAVATGELGDDRLADIVAGAPANGSSGDVPSFVFLLLSSSMP